MKTILKKIVVYILTKQVKKLRKKHSFIVVAVVGSIGKTSTKMAIAQTLGAHKRVRYQQGNYNDIVTIPLVIFGEELPSLFSIVAWIKLFSRNKKQIKSSFDYDVVVLEYGSDRPGQIEELKRYGQIDLAVITAITEEHMEAFVDMDSVAKEELSISDYSDVIIYNYDLITEEYRQKLPADAISYSIDNAASTYRIANRFNHLSGFEFDIKQNDEIVIHTSHDAVSDVQLYSAVAATVVSLNIGLKPTEIIDGLKQITPVSGRLRRLRGIKNSLIIDDTYNSSPVALENSLKTLYSIDSRQKIAVLGNMNELGQVSEAAHRRIGEICDPSELNILITIGREANLFLADNAEKKGCQVHRFDSPYDIGKFLRNKIEDNSIVLFKGSQNGVFLEEAVKSILADPEDANKLVRQSDYWMKYKQKQFKNIKNTSN